MLEIARSFQQKVVEKRLTPHFFCLRMLSSKKYYLVHPVGKIVADVITFYGQKSKMTSCDVT